MHRALFKAFFPFLLAGFLIGLFLTLQLRSEVAYVSSHPLDEVEFQQEVIQSFVDDQQDLEVTLGKLTAEVELAEKNLSQLYGAVDDDYREQIKADLGLTELTGSGVEIILDDSAEIDRNSALPDDSASLVHASDLRDVVNLLRTFPFEGISINDQRVVSATPITSAGNSILINNFNTVPPFKIKIITEVPDLVIQKLGSEIEFPSLYARIAANGLQLKFKKSENLTLPPYLGGYSNQHINLLESET